MPVLRRLRRSTLWPSAGLLVVLATGVAGHQGTTSGRRNVILFVADGLRHGSVNEQDTPALWAIRTGGVHFENSHSVFPTFTTANASAIATGHGLGDTGDFSNMIWPGFATFDTGNFGLLPTTPVPFIESDTILADLDDHYSGNYLGETTFLELARAHGYNTAAVGKLGPTAIQDAAAIAPTNRAFPVMPPTIIVDDTSATSSAPPLPLQLVRQLSALGLPTEPPQRTNGYGPTSAWNNGWSGDRTKPGTLAANVVQQQWLVDVTTQAILPSFANEPDKPFAIVFWSRDPDGTQHNQGDSLGTVYPGINGPTSRLGVRNADRCLAQLMAWLDAHPPIKANTDIVVTSDHGFATLSRREIDRTGRRSASEAAKRDYVNAGGAIDTAEGTLPPGFLAIHLALSLQTNLFDPDQRAPGSALYRKLALDPSLRAWEHPAAGNGLIGTDIRRLDGSDALAIVAANGGSDLIYVPNGNADAVRRIVALLLTYDYVGGIFVDDKFGEIPGTLPESDINLVGATKLPRPAIVVTFRVFYLNPADLQTAVQVSDTPLQTGQGMHGGFGRDSTFNSMAAIGPDFKSHFVDTAPVGNGDLTPTLAHLLGFDLPRTGKLVGRVLTEALAGGPEATPAQERSARSTAASGHQTLLLFQQLSGVRYLDAACLVEAAADQHACR
jgi:arylsulfatase A-like enzyme